MNNNNLTDSTQAASPAPPAGPFQTLNALFQRELNAGERVAVLLDIVLTGRGRAVPRIYSKNVAAHPPYAKENTSMGKILCIFFFLCAVLSGTLWFKKHRLQTQPFEDVETFFIELLGEVSETLFLRGSPTPDPEAVTRFKDAVDQELQRLNADRQHATGGRVSAPPAGQKAPFPTPSQQAKDTHTGAERYGEQLLPASPRFEQRESAGGLNQ